MKRLLLTACAALVAVSARAEELKFGLITPPPHVFTRAAERFGELLAERSGGRFTVTVHHSGQLGREPEMMQQMASGLLDFGLFTGGIASLRAPSLSGWFTPFMVDTVEQAARAAKLPAAREMLRQLEPAGMIGLGYCFAGMRHVLMRDRFVTSAEDVRGAKIRITPFPAVKTFWEGMEAVPTPIHLGDIYQALANGVIDGIDIDLDALTSLKFYEVAKSFTWTNHMAFPAVFVVSRRLWTGLGEDDQRLIAQVAEEILDWCNAEQAQAEERNFAVVQQEARVHRLENAREVFEPGVRAFDQAYGADPLIRALREEVREMLGR
ncbi:Solute-binding protein [bacterium HR39]|nr:Solute-binding protein [bacterium HR39]